MRRVLGAAIGTAVCLLFLTAPASAQFLTFVSAAGNDANTCFVQANPCKTLQRAINQTSAGGEVRLLTSLAGNGFINKSITIEGGRNTVIGTIAVNSASAIVRFRRLNLNGRHAFATGFNLIDAAAVHIEKCSVERYTQTGIALGPNVSTELVVSNSVSRDNGIRGALISAPSTAKATFESSRFASNGTFGIEMESGEVSITRSVAFGNGFVAISQSGGTTNITQLSAIGNIAGSASDGLFCSGGEMTVASSDIAANDDQGIEVFPPCAMRVSNNVSTANGEGMDNNGGTILTRGNNLITGNVNGTITPLPGE
jgi:hypothetical protein